ncbi:MAG: arsenite methyltransferase [Phycicoccus sp.]|nr:arsenite methyltransferase [Phycicoccus sp.]
MAHPTLTDDELTAAVTQRYAASARANLQAHTESSGGCGCGDDCCGGSARPDRAEAVAAGSSCCATSCCGDSATGADPITGNLYDPQDVPSAGALTASLGCGNPTALADLTPGMDVLDLGSGGGLDVLLSARRVGPNGTAFGVDMTDEMLTLAERNKAESGLANATFLKGTIDSVPLPDGSVDVIISNCVINLAADKDAVLAESHRLLRPGGRFAVSDIVLLRPIDDRWAALVGLWTGCIAGALLDTDYTTKLTNAGFTDPSVEVTRHYTRDDLETLAEQLVDDQLPAGVTREDAVAALEGAFASAFVRATKPA